MQDTSIYLASHAPYALVLSIEHDRIECITETTRLTLEIKTLSFLAIIKKLY